MKVSELWLKDWINVSLSAEQIQTTLTMAGLEVDALIPVAGLFDKVIVAKVLSTRPHPEADRLTLCEVEKTPGEIIPIVCGAKNVRAGLKVALATLGAKFENGLVIKEAKLRGEISHGMLCSSSELGMTETSEGILELPEDAPIGQDIRSYLGLDDTILDIDLTPNRADCFSMVGIARELGALTNQPFTPIEYPEINADSTVKINVYVEDAVACPKFLTRVVNGINVNATTPLWMKERLRRVGLRSIHPIVDITNYVMMALGQPMHAFDADKINNKLVVRQSLKNETIELLNDQAIQLDKPCLVIADDKVPLSIAGIMGGEASSVTEHTKNIILECAYFSPVGIATTARHYHLHSDSAMRFERGVDYGVQEQAMNLACKLIKDITGGSLGPVNATMNETTMPGTLQINFNPARVKSLTGVNVPDEEQFRILSALGAKVDNTLQSWKVTPPSHRFDMKIEVDCVEEIIRVNGYHHIAGEDIAVNLKTGTLSPIELLNQKAARFFTAIGFNETISYSFVDPKFQSLFEIKSEPMTLVNPISSELSVMRQSLFPGLIASMIFNLNRQQPAMRFFETGVIFEKDNGQVIEKPMLGFLMTGCMQQHSWNESKQDTDFYDAKGVITRLFKHINISNITFKPSEDLALHPGQSADIYYGEKYCGSVGVLHPKFMPMLELEKEVIIAQINLAHCINTTPPKYQPLSKYPQIRRDLSFLIKNEITAYEIENCVKTAVNQDILKDFCVFDVYKGEHIELGMKSVAITIVLQDATKTLVEDEINQIIDAILKSLTNEFSIQLRE